MMMELLRRLSYLWNRRRLEREMAEEMAYHRELMAPDRRTSFGDDLRCAKTRARCGLGLARSSASGRDIYGRLRPGVSPQASQQETLVLAATLRERRPDHVLKDECLEARPILEFDRGPRPE